MTNPRFQVSPYEVRTMTDARAPSRWVAFGALNDSHSANHKKWDIYTFIAVPGLRERHTQDTIGVESDSQT